jgi:RNA recognition motif-containing protein
MPDEYLPPNKILFLQNLPESVTKDQLNALFSQYPNLHEVRLVPSKKDIAFVEYLDEGSATVAKDALHNFKLDGENKIKVIIYLTLSLTISLPIPRSHLPGNKFRESPRCKLYVCTFGTSADQFINFQWTTCVRCGPADDVHGPNVGHPRQRSCMIHNIPNLWGHIWPLAPTAARRPKGEASVCQAVQRFSRPRPA